MKSAFFIQIITRCNALCPVGAIRIDENGKRTVACGPQNGGGTPANDDAVTLFLQALKSRGARLQRPALLPSKTPRPARRCPQRDCPRRQCQNPRPFSSYSATAVSKARFLRGFLNEAFIVAGNPQLFATASPISRPPLPYWRLMQMIVRSIFFAPVLHFSLDRPYRSRKMKYVKSIFDIFDISK